MSRGPRLVGAGVLLATSVLVALGPGAGHAASAGEGESRAWPYWKTDLHAHSVVSGDATADSGIIATYAKEQGFNAVYLTDHQAASYNVIGGVVASHLSFDDDAGANRQWKDEPSAPTATATATRSTEHALSGTNGYLVSATGAREAFGWIKRGPNLRSGQITAKFSVYPTRIDPDAGLYFSFSLGGDATVPSRESDGYTTQAGTVLPGRSTTFVWQLGAARSATDDGTTRVVTRPLTYSLNTWNTYTIDVTQAILDAFPDPETRPGDLNALLFLKMAASSSGGTATGWFDALSVDAANAPTKSAGAAAASADDFIARNAAISTWDTPTFRLLPGQEMGGNDHAQRLHFPITDPAQWQQFSKGVEGIPTVQASGYPVQLNHPGLPGGVTDEEALTNRAYGAEAMEAVERGVNDVMIRDFDLLLRQGEPLVGTWTSDSHRDATFGPATFLQAPVLSGDELLHSLFEGRAFLAKVDFPGQVSFTPDLRGGSYPARYPKYRSVDEPLSALRLQITAGIPAGSSVVWLRDGAVVRSDVVATDGGYDGQLVLSVPSGSTPVRAEVRRPDGSRLLMTEPVILRTSAALPRGVSAHLERVVTPSGTGYTSRSIPGVTGLAFDAASGALTTTVGAPAGSRLLEVLGTGSRVPAEVRRDGQVLPRLASRAALAATAEEGWAFDETRHELVVQGIGQTTSTALSVTLVPGADTTAPSTPAAFTALALNARTVRLAWEASEDDTGVTRYVVRRNGAVITALTSGVTTWDDTSVSPSTDYTYAIEAEDAASNHSGQVTAQVLTQRTTVTTVGPLADTYASSTAPSSSYGTAKTMKADSSPEVVSFVRFPAPPPAAALLGASLRLTSSAALPSGVRVHLLDNHTWGEATLNWNNAPPRGAQIAASTAMSGGAESAIDVLAGVGSATVDLALTNPSPTNVSLYTKENGTAVPRLVYETSTVAPTLGALSLATREDQPVTFTPTVGGGNGSPLTCRVVTPPASGTAWVAGDCSTGEVSPGRDFFGTDGFDLEVTDGAQRVRAHARLDVSAVNDPPSIDEEVLGASTDEDTPVSVTLAGSDVDGDCPLAFTIVSPPSHGRLGPLSDITCTGGSASATTLYTPDRDFHGNDALSFRLTDPSGASSNAAGVGITVAAVNDAPTAGDRAVSVAAGSAATWTPAATDVDGDALSCSISAPPSKGTASVAGDCTSGSYVASGTSSGSDSFTYAVSDGIASASATVSVTISGAPVLIFDDFETGGLAGWTVGGSATASEANPRAGNWAADVDSTTGGPAFLKRLLPGTPAATTTQAWVRVGSSPTSGLTALLRFRGADDAALLTLSVDSSRRLKLRNEVTRVVQPSATALPLGAYAFVEVRVTTAGPNSTVRVLVNGVGVSGLDMDADLGPGRVAAVQLGDNAKGPTGRFAYDDVRVTGA